MSIYEERLARIQAAINLEPVDKIPVISGLAACAAPMTHTKVSDFLKDMELNRTSGKNNRKKNAGFAKWHNFIIGGVKPDGTVVALSGEQVPT